MPDKKLTDAEIKKALDICSKTTNGCSHSKYTCEDCYLNGQPMCSSVLLQDAIDYFNRLQADVENYKQIAEHQQSVTLDRGFEIKRLKEKLEEYPFKCKVGNNSEIHSKSIEDYDHLINDIQAEAYREFAERLKTRFLNKNEVINNTIDNLLKELVGEGK